MFVEITRKSPKKTLKTPSFSPDFRTIVWLQPQASCPALAPITWRLGALKYKQFVTKNKGSKKPIRNLWNFWRFTSLPILFGSWKTSGLFCWKLLLLDPGFSHNMPTGCPTRPPFAATSDPRSRGHLLMTQLRCLLNVPHFFRWFFWGKNFHKFHPWPQIFVLALEVWKIWGNIITQLEGVIDVAMSV